MESTPVQPPLSSEELYSKNAVLRPQSSALFWMVFVLTLVLTVATAVSVLALLGNKASMDRWKELSAKAGVALRVLREADDVASRAGPIEQFTRVTVPAVREDVARLNNGIAAMADAGGLAQTLKLKTVDTVNMLTRLEEHRKFLENRSETPTEAQRDTLRQLYRGLQSNVSDYQGEALSKLDLSFAYVARSGAGVVICSTLTLISLAALGIILFRKRHYRNRTETVVSHTSRHSSVKPIGLDPLAQGLRDGLLRFDTEGKIIDVNASTVSMTGFERDRLVGQPVPPPFWIEGERDGFISTFRDLLDTPSAEREVVLKRASGESFAAWVTTSAVRRADGSIESYVATIKDLSKLRGMESRDEAGREEIAARAAMLSEMHQAAPIGAALHAADGSMLQHNRALMEMLHADKALVRGGEIRASDFVVSDPVSGQVLAPEQLPIARALATGHAVRDVAVRLKTPYYAEPIDLVVDAVPARAAGHGPAQVMVFYRRAAERPAVTEAAPAPVEVCPLRAAEPIVAGAAHDLNNTLTSLEGSAELAEDAVSRGGDVAGSFARLGAAISEARESVGLLHAFVSHSSGGVTEFDLAAFGPVAGKQIARLVPSTFRIAVRHDGVNGQQVRASRARLLRAMLLLACDARKAQPQGGLIEVVTSTAGGRGLISISGVGDDVPGEVRSIVASHAGEVRVEQRAAGACVVLDLPAAGASPRVQAAAAAVPVMPVVEAPKAPAQVMNVQARPSMTSAGLDQLDQLLAELGVPVSKGAAPKTVARSEPELRGRALLVEDDAMAAPVLAQALRNAGMTVDVTSSGEEAVVSFRERPGQYAVVVASLGLPGLDGASALRRMRKIQPGVPAVLLAGEEMQALPPDLVSEQSVLLVRPFSAGQLVNEVARVLHSIV